MGYYRGDYYRGDYYRGDPFIGGLIARGVGMVAGALGRKAVTRTAAAAGAVAAGVPVVQTVARQLPAAPAGASGPPIRLGPIGIDPRSALPGGQPFVTMGVRKRRRMNVLNPRALKRALRRAEGFEKIAKRTVNALHTGPKRFKSTKRRSS